MKTGEIRKLFVDYFKGKGHTHVPSSPLIPRTDPTLLFTNAGMVQFKGVFLGEEKRAYTRAVTVQKCLRAGGKHNDLENVGRTLRHHTFFEMLGNFSFGDYFKEEAIAMAWEFLTSVLRLPKDRLWVTVFREDDEAAGIWKKVAGLPGERIVRMGEEDNFWSMGDTGPCGPCSEIIIDQGEEVGCGRPDCRVGCSCDRFLELWNLVFMQYNRDAKGRLNPLPRPSIDTGMGLERLASILQGVKGDYGIDIFRAIIERIEGISGRRYGVGEEDDFSIRVIADHSRAIAFLVAEGLIPSNEGRGYVLRRILRRAARHGRRLGIERPFLTSVCERVVEVMGDTYPELLDARGFMKKVVEGEEERFLETLDRGLEVLSQMLEELKREGRKEIPGECIFRLYDTYGFPIDITMDVAREEGLGVDTRGFEEEMEKQRRRGREAWRGGEVTEEEEALRRLLDQGIRTRFTGYTEVRGVSRVVALIKDGRIVDEAGEGEVGIVVEETPFYGEAGGQVGDRGFIEGKGLHVEVMDTKRPAPDLIVHKGRIRRGVLRKGDVVELLPDASRRKATSLNHTATHLLHAVLRRFLGDHVRQAGSLVTPERLRFDFSHFSSLTQEELDRVEAEVNRLVREDLEVSTEFLPFEEALKRGAIALFDEKYGDLVRLVSIDDVSKELCGGIHVKRTGEIGLFRILSESAVAAGVRRIEAVTGEVAYRSMKADEKVLERMARRLKGSRKDVEERFERLLKRYEEMEKEVEGLKARIVDLKVASLLSRVREVDGIKVVSGVVDAEGPEELRLWADRLRERIGSGVIALGGSVEDRAFLLIALTKDLTKRFHAGHMVRELARYIGGRGGGRPDMAQAGGKDPKGLKRAVEEVYTLLQGREAQ